MRLNFNFMWTNWFDKTYVLNLRKRIDRLIHVCEEMSKYNIDFELVTSIENKENGAEGLKDTIVELFNNALLNNYSKILVFEDDIKWVTDPNPTMEMVVKELPEYWHICYLGGQPSNGFNRRHSSSLLQLDTCFATHAWAISNQGMKEILASGLKAPIDNSIVDTVQKQQKCFITYPLLASQKEGYSDIGGTEINWNPFIINKYNEKLSLL